MSGVVAVVRENIEEMVRAAARIVRRAAIAGMLAVAALHPAAMDANAQTVPQDVCVAASNALTSYVRANIDRITDPADRAQLSILSQWLRAGCQGTVRLTRSDETIAVAARLQGAVGSFRLDRVLILGN